MIIVIYAYYFIYSASAYSHCILSGCCFSLLFVLQMSITPSCSSFIKWVGAVAFTQFISVSC